MSSSLFQSSEVPESVRQAFADRPHLTMPELSKTSRMDPKTIRRHIDAGRLNWRNIGTGSVRVRRGFVLADVESFYRSIKRGGTPCLSIGTETPPTGNSISSAQVIDFVGRQKSPKPDQNGKRKPLRRKSVGRPSDLLGRSGSPDVNQ
jgi:hypothetical protein